RVPVSQALAVQRFAGRRLQQPYTGHRGAARQFAQQRQGAAIRRAARVAGNQQARRWKSGQLVEQAPALFAVVEYAGIGDTLGQCGRPSSAGIQLDGHQHGAVGVFGMAAGVGQRQGVWRRVADAQAFAGWVQAFAQQRVAGGGEVQVQASNAVLPAPQAKQAEQQARQQAIHQQHAEQPAGPGLAGAFLGQSSSATGADLFNARQAETEQRRQGAQRLGQGNEAVAAKNGRFPDEAVAARGQHRQQQEQRGQQRQQPQTVHHGAQAPAGQAAALQQEHQCRRQLRSLGVAGEFFAQPQPQPAQRAAAVAGQQQAQRP